jgi:endonuclease/exonuclease/phosphatase family metal-dependent hydrolase
MPAILEFLSHERPDILLCQEAYNGDDKSAPVEFRSVPVIAGGCGFTASAFAPSFMNTKRNLDEGCAVLARWPIIAQPSVFLYGQYGPRDVADPASFPTSPRVLQSVAIASPVGQLNVFNFQGVYDLDGDNNSPQRQAMSALLIQAIQSKTNVILGGDCNAKPTNPAMRAIETSLHSVFGNELTTSFNMRRKDNPGYATAAVDVMYIGSNIRVISKACPDVDISDHRPLIVELEINAE